MLERVISGAVLAVLAVFFLLSGGTILACACLFLSVIAYLELTKATKVRRGAKINFLEIIGVIGVFLYYALIYIGELTKTEYRVYLVLFICLLLISYMFVYVFAFPKFVSEQVMTAFTCFIYGPVMLSFIYLSRNLENGIYYVWLIFISSWISDTCAYLVGVTIGKHKLAPVLSPKKSIEGAAGGILGSALVGALYGYFVIAPRVNNAHVIWILAVISAIGALISQVGDLAASGIKRNHEIKDYGKLIPGHGGVMDRFDSVIFTAPIVYGMLILWMKP